MYFTLFMCCNISNTSFVVLQEHQVQRVHQVLFLMFRTCSLKLIFSIYIYLTQALNEIHVRYDDQPLIIFRQQWLTDGGISNVDDLIDEIKRRLKNTIEKVLDKVVILCRGMMKSWVWKLLSLDYITRKT